ncbi:ROK family glucokinase [Jeotgalibacillus sp. R-1-5s-1]|uniref:ROK family glucokinase n=1 Tax=Jeotgalibacillus sp. R-1-5s-1 TaxID=2555897 RepID=UPI00106D80B0|nr:ROK family glucokinase [Jeotgalibacillus sp. R-1-5s-1]TFD92287.1 ROK family glucokinase [Jeotgalibacillus sp. R-1-5s-1]
MKKFIFGVDIGGTTTKLAVIEESGLIVEKWEIPTNTTNNGVSIIPDIAAAVKLKQTQLSISSEQILGIGVGAPGPVNMQTGILYTGVNIGWEQPVALRDELHQQTGLPVVIENDANVAAIGEMWKGAGDGARDVVCVTLGTGVGGGVIVNGDIAHGIKGAAGEIGHITAVPEGGYQCNCGKKGCLETVASATGVVRLAKEEAAKDTSSVLNTLLNEKGEFSAKDVFDHAKQGDEAALKAVDRLTFYLGLALANLGSALNPEKIVIGGGVSQAGPILLDRLREKFKAFAFPTVAESTEITVATLGNDAGVIGAAWLIKYKH